MCFGRAEAKSIVQDLGRDDNPQSLCIDNISKKIGILNTYPSTMPYQTSKQDPGLLRAVEAGRFGYYLMSHVTISGQFLSVTLRYVTHDAHRLPLW